MILILFIAAQGAVVWASAAAGLRICGAAGRLARAAALAVSYIAWCAATATAYVLAGGSGATMEGDALLLMLLLLTALAGSAAYGAVWILWPLDAGDASPRGRHDGGASRPGQPPAVMVKLNVP